MNNPAQGARIYLDHAATTPLHPDVLAAMLPYFREHAYNPSSLHTEGRAARAALDAARDRVAHALGAARKTVTFVGSGTEGDNQALVGAVAMQRARGRHIVTSAIEHHAVLHTIDALKEEGCKVTILPVNEHGVVDAAAFAAALRPDTVLASIMYANNEIGTVQPIRELAALARARGVLFHTDAVQAPGWLPLNVDDLGVDMLTLSAHKFYGPKGVAVLYVRTAILPPLIRGGGQEFGRRSGTEDVAGIVGLAHALDLAVNDRTRRSFEAARMRDRLESGLRGSIPRLHVNGAGAPRLPNVTNLSFEGVDSEALLARLDLEGVAASAGSACTSGVLEPSHVVAALGLDAVWQRGVVRFSLGSTTTDAEIDRLLELMPKVVADLRGAAVAQ